MLSKKAWIPAFAGMTLLEAIKDKIQQAVQEKTFPGCVVMCDFVKQIALVVLSNYTFPKRKQNKDLINQTRSNIADIVFGDF